MTQTSQSGDRFNVQTGPNNTNIFGGIHFHGEYLTSITPIEDEPVEPQEQETLSDEFYRGISARYEHILAGVDQPRPGKLNEIVQKFNERQVVIVHGASGQGKTTLAYRYLHDRTRHHRRFQVQVVEGRQHAVEMANALIAQANENTEQISVYVDVSPTDVGWEELAKQLSHHRNIQTLITIREEDFRRVSISGTELQFASVDLNFDRSEAEEIYHSLTAVRQPPHILDFNDAWRRFGDKGPLMEFVYFVTQGDFLREKLRQQIQNIEDEIRANRRSEAELRLLRMVSVAAAFEARLEVKGLVRFLQVPAASRTLEVMEKEYYLLRTLENGTLVGGLHPVRSAILADLLTDSLNPWVENAVACLSFLIEQDIGSFLLYAFLRDQAELEPLFTALNTYQPKQWNAVAGVLRALLWLGIKQYVAANQQLINETYAECQQGWIAILDIDIAEASPGMSEGLLSTLSPFFNEERRAHINTLRNRQTDKQQIFVPAFNWLSRLTQEPSPPRSESDWVGMAEVLFWVGRLQVPLRISEWLARIDLENIVETLSLTNLADLLLGLFHSNEAKYQSWLTQHQAQLIDRYRQETQTVVWEDDGQTVRSHFAIELFRSDQSSEASQAIQSKAQRGFVDLAMERLELCRRFFPDREVFSSRGYGHRNPITPELPDDTVKNIPKSNFPLHWLVSLNATFRGLAEQAFRPETWEEYTYSVMNLRQSIVQSLQQLRQGLEIHFRSRRTTQILGQHIDSDEWTRSRQLLTSSPLLPRCAFDSWGFISDSRDHTNELNTNILYKQQNLALETYSSYLKALNLYVNKCSNFFEQAEWVLNFHPYFRNGENAQVQEIAQQLNIDVSQKANLSVINLTDAWKALPKLQQAFKGLLLPFVSLDELCELEHQEQSVFSQIWCSWYFFAFHPNQQFQNATWGAKQQFSDQVRAIRKSISRELRRISQNGLQISILSEEVLWDEEPALWLQLDGNNPIDVYNAIETVVEAIRQAIVAVPQNELRRYAIELSWSTILIVPLVQGRSLAGQAWRFSSILFSVNPRGSLGSWNFIPILIPTGAFSQLSLSTWTDPRLDTVQQLLEAIGELSLLASHLQDFERLPELDDQGAALLQPYIQQCATQLSDSLQTVLDVATELLSYYNHISPGNLENRPHLTLVVQGLSELHEHIMPITDRQTDGGFQIFMNLAEFTEWANRLQTVQGLAFAIYLLWVADVVQEINDGNSLSP